MAADMLRLCTITDQARQLLHKLIQSESHRRALIYQKRYLEMVIGQRDSGAMTSSRRPVSGRRRFRVAVVAVCFILRLSSHARDYWHCPHRTRSRVYVTVQCPSVCLSHSPAALRFYAGLLLGARRERNIDRLLPGDQPPE